MSRINQDHKPWDASPSVPMTPVSWFWESIEEQFQKHCNPGIWGTAAVEPIAAVSPPFLRATIQAPCPTAIISPKDRTCVSVLVDLPCLPCPAVPRIGHSEGGQVQRDATLILGGLLNIDCGVLSHTHNLSPTFTPMVEGRAESKTSESPVGGGGVKMTRNFGVV